MSPLPGSKRAGWEKCEQGGKNSISVAARLLDRVNLQKTGGDYSLRSHTFRRP